MSKYLYESQHLHQSKKNSLIRLMSYLDELFDNPVSSINPQNITQNIAIIGGGVAGLSTALILQKMNYTNVKVYESDASMESRPQGYSLTIQETIPYLNKLGIGQEILKLNLRNESQIWYKSDGEKLREKLNNSDHRWSIPLPRQKLRTLLLEQLMPDTVIWNKRVTNFGTTSTNQVNIIFSDNTSTTVDLMVIADGMRSNLRQQLIGNQLNYTGYRIINGINTNTEFFDNKEFQIFDGKSKLFIKPFSNHESMWELTFPATNKSDYNNNHEALNQSLLKIDNWHPTFYNFIKSTPPNKMRHGFLYDRDPDQTFNFTNQPYTIIGDAAHAMTPFVGQGANNALWDGLTLVYHLVKSDNLTTSLRKYEEDMLDRSRYFVERSRQCVKFYHTPYILDNNYINRFLKHDTDFL